MGRLLWGEHASTPQSGVEAPRLFKTEPPQIVLLLCVVCVVGYPFRWGCQMSLDVFLLLLLLVSSPTPPLRHHRPTLSSRDRRLRTPLLLWPPQATAPLLGQAAKDLAPSMPPIHKPAAVQICQTLRFWFPCFVLFVSFLESGMSMPTHEQQCSDKTSCKG